MTLLGDRFSGVILAFRLALGHVRDHFGSVLKVNPESKRTLMSDHFLWPWSLLAILAFGVAYGIFLHLAIKSNVYKITRFRPLDYVLLWGLALATAITPLLFYVAFGFEEFAETADGQRQQLRFRRTAQAEVALLVLYGLAVLASVPQKPMTG